MRLKTVQIGDVERIDAHHKAILDFIKKAPSQTENRIVKSMEEQKICSKMTTLKKLDQLLEMGEIKDLINEGPSGFHKFIINNNNTFNLINNELSELEKIVELMSEPMKRFISIGGDNPDDIRRVPDRWILKELDDKFFGAYKETTREMLEILLIEISNKIQSQKDAWTLYKKIIELQIKLNKQNSWFEGEGVEGLYLTSNAFIQFHSQDLNEIKQENLKFAENHGIPINSLVKSLKLRIQDFQSHFLPYPKYPTWGKSNANIFRVSDKQPKDTLSKGRKKRVRKTTESHEKSG
jgi:hypothetical protein